MCSQTEAAPGPPLNENVSGRFDAGAVPRSSVYAMKKTFASTSPASVLSGRKPVVAV